MYTQLYVYYFTLCFGAYNYTYIPIYINYILIHIVHIFANAKIYIKLKYNEFNL